MKPLRPTLLAQRIRVILNNWPQFSYMKPAVLAKPSPVTHHVPEPLDNYDSEGAARLEALRDKQAYLQSLDLPTAEEGREVDDSNTGTTENNRKI